MIFNFKTVIEDYCGTGKLSEEEVDFLEREHIKTWVQLAKYYLHSEQGTVCKILSRSS